jgi:hypothetical protein
MRPPFAAGEGGSEAEGGGAGGREDVFDFHNVGGPGMPVETGGAKQAPVFLQLFRK